MQRFINRLNAQKRANIGEPVAAKQTGLDDTCASQTVLDEPLSAKEIEFYLKKLDTQANTLPENTVVFDSIQAFASWYEGNKHSFNDKQNVALGTLVTVRNQINLGCSCRLHIRQNMGNDYFKHFFIKNANTDIIPSIKQAFAGQNVILKVGDVEFMRI
jgi:hypothetical protein